MKEGGGGRLRKDKKDIDSDALLKVELQPPRTVTYSSSFFVASRLELTFRANGKYLTYLSIMPRVGRVSKLVDVNDSRREPNVLQIYSSIKRAYNRLDRYPFDHVRNSSTNSCHVKSTSRQNKSTCVFPNLTAAETLNFSKNEAVSALG